MSNKRTTVYLRGKMFWAKIFGTPRPNFDGDAREWTFEFEPNDASVEQLRELGLEERLRSKADKKGYEDRGPYLILKRKEFKFDGVEKNEHIRVVDADNADWPQTSLIGNGSEVDVKVTIVDYGPRKKEGIYPVAIRVLDLVQYVSQEFESLPDDDKRVMAARSKRKAPSEDTFAKDFGLEEDDDAPEEVEPTPVTAPKRGRPARIPDGDLDDDIPM